MGIQNSQKMLHEIIDYFRLQNNEEILNKAPKLYISGCLNSCGVHQVGSIGLCGKRRMLMVYLQMHLNYLLEAVLK